MNKNSKLKVSKILYNDIALISFLVLVALINILSTLVKYPMLNTIFIISTVVLIMITYFYGLLAGLIANLIFIAGQVLIMVYQYTENIITIPWLLSYWLILPILCSFSMYFVMKIPLELQKENAHLQQDLIEQGAFDEETNLRTLVSYIEDCKVFIETGRRFEIPVSTLVISIRYYEEIRRMVSEDNLKLLLLIISNVIKETIRENDIVYFIDNDNLTWATLLYSEAPGVKIVSNRIKTKFLDEISKTPELSSLAISLVAGISQWDPETMEDAYSLVEAGKREIQYDVL